MATVIDLLRHLGQHAAPDGDNALAGPVMLPGVTDSPLALPLPPALVTAWTRLVGRATLGHHALAISAAHTQHSVALMGHGASPHNDLLLLVLSQLQRPPQRAMLAIVPHDETLFRTRLIALAQTLDIRWLDAAQPGGRIHQAQLVIATPTDLHRRVLRYHDRAWRWLWPQIQFVALPEIHRYTGVEVGHIHWLLRRVERLAVHTPLQILSSLAPVSEVGAALGRLLSRSMQVVAAPDGPSHSTLIALWRCGSDRGAAVTELAQQLTKRGLATTVLGRDTDETERLRTLAADKGMVQPQEARVAIVAGIPSAIADRQSLLRSGYRLLILLAGDEPHELLFSAQPDLLLSALPHWPLGNSNPYVVAAQLTCAAAERPLEEAEIDRWGVGELRDRLIKKGILQPLPSGDLWQTSPEVDDPYTEIDPRTIGGSPVVVLDPNGQPIDTLAPALHNRCALPDQVFAPGLRIAHRDDATQTVRLASDSRERATVVLADVTVNVREEQGARTIRFGKQTIELVKGKVWAIQQVLGLRELWPDATQRRLPARVAETQWLAAACWLPLSAPVPDPQTIGWAITQTLPLVALAGPAAITPAYDATQRRLYLIETEPGGVGITDCMYHQFETLIDLALRIAQACAARPLYRQLATSELTWLHGLYGSVAPSQLEQKANVTEQPQEQPSASKQPADIRTPPAQPLVKPALPATSQERRAESQEVPIAEQPSSAPEEHPSTRRIVPPVKHPTPVPGVGAAPPAEQIKQTPDAPPPSAGRTGIPRPTRLEPTSPPPRQPAAESPPRRGVPSVAPATERPAIVSGSASETTERPAEAVPHAARPTAPSTPTQHPRQEQAPPATSRRAAVYTTSNEPPLAPPKPPSAIASAQPPRPGNDPDQAQAEKAMPRVPEPHTVAARKAEIEATPSDTYDVVASHPANREAPGQAGNELPKVAPAQTAMPSEPTPISAPRRRPGTGQYRIEDLLPPLEDEDETDTPPTWDRQPTRVVDRQPQAAGRSSHGATRLDSQATQQAEESKHPLLDTANAAQRDGNSEEQDPPDNVTPIPTVEHPASQPRAAQPASRPLAAQPTRPTRPQRQHGEPQRPFSHRSPVRQPPAGGQQNRRDRQPTPQPERRPAPTQRPQPTDNPTRRPAASSYRRDQIEDTPPRTRPSDPPRRDDVARPDQARTQPPAAPEPEADVNAMIVRMRRLRQEREAAQRQTAPRMEQPAQAEPVELRFQIGERVQCLPYGTGIVRASRIVGGREQVRIAFPDYGEIEVDPALSLIRQLGARSSDEQNEVEEPE